MYSLCNGYTSMYIHYVRYLFASGFLVISYIFFNGPGFPSTTQQYDSHKLFIYLILEVYIDIKSML